MPAQLTISTACASQYDRRRGVGREPGRLAQVAVRTAGCVPVDQLAGLAEIQTTGGFQLEDHAGGVPVGAVDTSHIPDVVRPLRLAGSPDAHPFDRSRRRPCPRDRVSTVLPASPAGAVAVNRPADPVVITGASSPRCRRQPGTIVASPAPARPGAQIPVQVDERKVLNFGTVYSGAANNVNVARLRRPEHLRRQGPEHEARRRRRDRVHGPRRRAAPAGAVAPPAATKAGTGVQVLVADPLVADAAAETVRVPVPAQGGRSTPGAGRDYVDYPFSLLVRELQEDLQAAGRAEPREQPRHGAYYQHHFGDRWMSDRIKVTAPGSSGVDILDRHKKLFAPGCCGRSENTFNDAEGAFITNKIGPVRAIRSYIGANSGPNTQRDHLFYDRREDVRTYLRVHAIPGIMDFFDYSPAATGMTYRNDLNPAGVTIDGTPDAPVTGAPEWEQVDRPAGLAHQRGVAADDASRRRPHVVLPRRQHAAGARSAPVTVRPTGRAASWVNGDHPVHRPAARLHGAAHRHPHRCTSAARARPRRRGRRCATASSSRSPRARCAGAEPRSDLRRAFRGHVTAKRTDGGRVGLGGEDLGHLHAR